MYPRLGTQGAPVRIAKENRLKGGTGSSGCPEPSLCSRVRRVQPVSPGHKGLICAAEEDDTKGLTKTQPEMKEPWAGTKGDAQVQRATTSPGLYNCL